MTKRILIGDIVTGLQIGFVRGQGISLIDALTSINIENDNLKSLINSGLLNDSPAKSEPSLLTEKTKIAEDPNTIESPVVDGEEIHESPAYAQLRKPTAGESNDLFEMPTNEDVAIPRKNDVIDIEEANSRLRIAGKTFTNANDMTPEFFEKWHSIGFKKPASPEEIINAVFFMDHACTVSEKRQLTYFFTCKKNHDRTIFGDFEIIRSKQLRIDGEPRKTRSFVFSIRRVDPIELRNGNEDSDLSEADRDITKSHYPIRNESINAAKGFDPKFPVRNTSGNLVK